MAYLILMIGVGIIGIMYLIKGEFKFTKNKIVDAKTGRILGAIMVVAVIIDLIGMTSSGGVFYLSLIAMIIAIIVGFTRSQPINK